MAIRFRNLSLKNKLIFITLFVAVIIGIVSLICYQVLVSRSNEMLYQQTANSLDYLSTKISASLDSITENSLNMAVDLSFQKNLQIVNQEINSPGWGIARSEIYEAILRNFRNNIITITIEPLMGPPIYWGRDSVSEDEETLEEARALALEYEGALAWMFSDREDGSVLCVRAIKNTKDPFLEHMGVLIVRVDLSKLVKDAVIDNDYILSLYSGDRCLYPAPASDESRVPIPEQESTPYAIQRLDGSMMFIARSTVEVSNDTWDLTMGFPYDEVFNSLVNANVIFIVSVILAIIISVIISSIMLGGITDKFNLLVYKMQRVQSGNLEPIPNLDQSYGEDELGILNRQFDTMTADFKKVIDDNYVKELLLTQTQLKSLEQQINPHFLYNALESINWFAVRSQEKSISTIAQSLGTLLHSSLSEQQDTIPLHKELSILNSYVQIQKIRFPDTLFVEFDVEEEIMPFLIPKMSIQPLVENAIAHSLEENIGDCHIQVRAYKANDLITVEVENDGSEIEEDILFKLKNQEVKARGNGIGLGNIDARIKLLFGDTYGLSFQNTNNGVIVSYQIPACQNEMEIHK